MKVISGFQHSPGLHCGSTAMRNLLCYRGLELDEAMCFGLGSGLGFAYLRDVPETGISHLFHGRTRTLEHDLCTHLSLDIQMGTDDDADHAWEVARESLAADTPLVLSVELSRLPYYNSRTPFPGHRVLLVGYDDRRGEALVSDNEFERLQTVSYQALRAAWHAPVPSSMFPLRNEWLTVNLPLNPRPLAEAVQVALRANALEMVEDRSAQQGIRGMQRLADDFVNWGKAPDWKWCARFGYQIIERRGTGGAAFRKMYARYLREAEALLPDLRSARLAEGMEDIAREWTGLALLLKRISDEREIALFEDAGDAIRHIAAKEKHFWDRVLEVVVQT